ncbi:MAG TPA: succinate dehydrogenase [Candidatus Dormibacteraeota bacterium]
MATTTAPTRPQTQAPQPKTDSAGLPWWGYSAFFMGAQTIFGIYVFVVVMLDFGHNFSDPYLSPFFSPLFGAPSIAGFILSPGVFIVWSPLAFRASCYYYRKAYYRAFFAPPTCSMAPPSRLRRIRYWGETKFPAVLSNFHRFALYTAILNVAFLLVDFLNAFHLQQGAQRGHLMIGLGTIVLGLNVVMLSAYTFGCHAFRHLAGGSLDCYSCSWAARTRRSLWERVTALNERHGLFALVSLFTVWGADVYVRLLTHGVFADPRLVF